MCTVASKSGWTGKNAWRMGQRCGDDRHNHCSGPTNPTGAPNHIRSVVLCFSTAYHMVLCVCVVKSHKPDTTRGLAKEQNAETSCFSGPLGTWHDKLHSLFYSPNIHTTFTSNHTHTGNQGVESQSQVNTKLGTNAATKQHRSVRSRRPPPSSPNRHVNT